MSRSAFFRYCTNTDPQRDSIFTKGPADVLDHATSEIAIGTKLGIDATKKLLGEGFKRPWPPLIRMDETVRKKIDGCSTNEMGSTPDPRCHSVCGSTVRPRPSCVNIKTSFTAVHRPVRSRRPRPKREKRLG
jgi:hypothetical protein